MALEINVGEGDLTHYLGNDDYRVGISPFIVKNNPKLDGFEASGNEDDEDLRVTVPVFLGESAVGDRMPVPDSVGPVKN